MNGAEPGVDALVARTGGHPAAAAGLDPRREEDRFAWWTLALLLAATRDPGRAVGAWRSLDARGVARAADALASRPTAELAAPLDAAGIPRPEHVAARLVRSAASLQAQHRGSLDRLAAGAEGLEELARALGALAPGVGASTVRRFLAPLRATWSQAEELPVAPAAAAAAARLGWTEPGAPPEDAWAAIARRAEDDAQRTDLEAALERLGARVAPRGRRA